MFIYIVYSKIRFDTLIWKAKPRLTLKHLITPCEKLMKVMIIISHFWLLASVCKTPKSIYETWTSSNTMNLIGYIGLLGTANEK